MMKSKMLTKAVPLFGVGMGLMALHSCGNAKKDPVDRPNIVFILADDIGYGDFSCNGETTVNTPNVDKVAQSGIRFTDAHSVAATSTPSRYSLLTGEYAWRRDDTDIAAGNAGMIIRPDQYTMADLFKDNGYKTGVVGKWHLGLGDKTGEQNWNGFITPGPSDLGFDYSYIMAATADRTPCVYVENQRIVNLDPSDPISVSYLENFEGEPTGRENPELLTKMKPSNGHDMSIVNGISRIGYMKGGKAALWIDENIADSITSHAVSFIEKNKDNPFFLYLGTNDIHVPRVPHPRFVGKSGMGARGDAILEFDWTVGQIVETLEKAGIMDNTIIIITSDNGPVVDDGYADQAVELLGDHRPWGSFRGGKYSMFEAATRVPLIVSGKGISKGKVSDALVSQIDFFASFAEMLNYELPKQVVDSKSALVTLKGDDDKGRDYVIEQGTGLSVSTGEWKYIEPNNGLVYDKFTNIELGNDTLPQLYNLTKDIGERENLAFENREKLEELKQIIAKERAVK